MDVVGREGQVLHYAQHLAQDNAVLRAQAPRMHRLHFVQTLPLKTQHHKLVSTQPKMDVDTVACQMRACKNMALTQDLMKLGET